MQNYPIELTMVSTNVEKYISRLSLSKPAQMGWGDVQQRGDVFERKELEQIRVPAEQFVVALLW